MEDVTKYELAGSFLEFTRVFYKLRTHRLFQLTEPSGRESHYITIARALTQVIDGHITRLIINIPPRMGKTEMLINFVSWALGIYPDSNFLYVSYNLDLAMKQTGTIKNIVELRQFKDLFNVYLKQDTRSKSNFETTHGGSVYAAGAGGTITGRGAGVRGIVNRFSGAIIIDDIHKPDEATSDTIRESIKSWYYNTMMSRVNNAQTPIIFIGQRVHEDDLAGHFIKSGGWHVLSLPAIDENNNILHPDMHTLEGLRDMEEKARYEFAAQYQQNPQPAGGGIFMRDDFFLLDEEPELLITFMTVDTAETDKNYNDATVFSFWGLYLIPNINRFALHWINCWEIRVEPKDLEVKFIEFYHECNDHKLPPTVAIIEKKSTGVTLVSVLNKQRGLIVKGVDRTVKDKSKVQRFLDMQPYVAAKVISLNKDARHTEECIEHMIKITANDSHAHDDRADTAQLAVEFGLMKPYIQNMLSKQKDGQDKATAAKIMSNFTKIQQLRKSQYV